MFDPDTKQVIDYKIEIRGTKQRMGEAIERGARRRGRAMIETIENLPITSGEFVGGVVRTASGQMNIKRGMRTSIPGQAPTPRAVITALPQRQEGVIGSERPAIAKMGEVDFDKAKQLYTGESPIKMTPKTGRLTVNGIGTKEMDAGFGGMFMKKKTEEVGGV